MCGTKPYADPNPEDPMRLVSFLSAALLLCACSAYASYGGKPDLPTPASGSGQMQAEGEMLTPRQQAEPYYRDAYDDVMKGAAALTGGDAKAAEKRFRRALDRSRRAVEADTTYAEAWNLVGFTSRKLGDYPHSFEAYRVALRLKPDFALAHEYYGEGLLETGDLQGALLQLAALRRIGDAETIAELQSAVEKYRAAHPEGAAGATDAAK
jgi:tetratricopeptide (TPR) repeat protein